MCLECDGYPFEQSMRRVDLHIRVHGWSLTMVDDDEPWCYTIGLLESFAHPELMVIDMKMEAEVELIRWVVDMLETDGAVDDERLARHDVQLVPVHDRHLADHWFATWSNHYGTLPPPGSFVQIIPPPSGFCEQHQDLTRRFDRLDLRPIANRAARRRAARQRRR